MAKEADVARAYQFTDIDLEVHRRAFEGFFKAPWNQGTKTIIDARNSSEPPKKEQKKEKEKEEARKQ
jgi:hypothetical protein